MVQSGIQWPGLNHLRSVIRHAVITSANFITVVWRLHFHQQPVACSCSHFSTSGNVIFHSLFNFLGGVILVSFSSWKRCNGQSASVADNDQTMLPLQQLLIDISANDNRTTGRYRQVDIGSTDSQGRQTVSLLQTRRLHAALDAGMVMH